MTPDNAQLVYPAPTPPPSLSRPRAIAILVALGAAVLAILGLAAWFGSFYLAAAIMINSFLWFHLDQRLRTVVTAESIEVRGWIRTWTLPVAEAQELLAPNLAGKPVYLITRQGRRRRLAKVAPDDMTDIAALTGLSSVRA